MVDGWFGDGDWSDSGNPLDNNIWDSPEPEEDPTRRLPTVTTTGTAPESNADAVQLWLLLYGQTPAAPPDIRIPAAFGPGEDAGGDGDCATTDTQDAFANDIQDIMEQLPNFSTTEHAAVMAFINGQFVITGIAQGLPTGEGGWSTHLTGPDNSSDAVGIIHNHPSNGDPIQDATSRYPSARDWLTAQAFVDAGNLSSFSLYLIGPDGVMREFDFADREMYENLSRFQMIQGDDLPPDMNPDGSEGEQSCDDDTF